MLLYLKSLLQLVLAPKEGWEDIAIDDREPSSLMAAGFFPILILASATVFMSMVYHMSVEISVLIQRAVVMLMKYVVTYFIGLWTFGALLPRYTVEEPDERHIQTFLSYSVSLMAIVSILANCLPMELPVIKFLPLYVLLIMFRGATYLDIRPGCHVSFVIMAFCSVMLPPVAFTLLFNLIIPS